MAKTEIIFGELSGGDIDLSDYQTSSTSSFSATVGKKYFVYTSVSIESNCGLSSGATEVTVLKNTGSSYPFDYTAYHYIAIVQATATTVQFKGANNTVFYKEL